MHAVFHFTRAKLMQQAPPVFVLLAGMADYLSEARGKGQEVKGVGELGTIGATPAVANAVVDALVRAGKADRAYQIQMPMTAEKLWRALADA